MIPGYIGRCLIYMAITAVIYLPCRILFLKRKKRDVQLWHELSLLLFWALAVGIVSQTLFPKISMGITDSGEWIFDTYFPSRAAPNFIPFQTVRLFWERRGESTDWQSMSLLNLAGNVLLFVPIGFLFPPAFPKRANLKFVFFCALGSILCIETLQYFLGRVADIDDVLLNVAGILLGYGIFQVFRKILQKMKG